MKRVFYTTRYIGLSLKKSDFKPFTRTIGPISIDLINNENVNEVIDFYPDVHKPFLEMLSSGDVGVFVRHKENIVGYMWRKDFNEDGKFKSDGYLPLQGKCSHLHWARVKKEMRGRGLQLLMLSWLVKHAYEQGVDRIYTDVEIGNEISMKGIIKIGFKEIFRLLVFKTDLNWRTISIKYSRNCE